MSKRHLYLPNPEAKSRFRDLENCTCIGWDVDETLIGHRNSHRIHQFITAHPEIRHLIVTFRNSHLADQLEEDLSHYRSAPPLSAFYKILHIEDEMFENYRRYVTLVNNNLNVNNKDVREFLQEYEEWKGTKCAEYGAQALVDDLVDRVQRGCDKHGVMLIHPDEL